MRQRVNVRYRNAAEEFASKVASALGDQVDSIVFYGSAARGEAKKYSDIDILVISPDPRITRGRISKIRSDFTYEGNFTFFISLVHFSREEFYKLMQLGSPFMHGVVTEGVILYDNGTFSRIREEAVAASR